MPSHLQQNKMSYAGVTIVLSRYSIFCQWCKKLRRLAHIEHLRISLPLVMGASKFGVFILPICIMPFRVIWVRASAHIGSCYSPSSWCTHLCQPQWHPPHHPEYISLSTHLSAHIGSCYSPSSWCDHSYRLQSHPQRHPEYINLSILVFMDIGSCQSPT